MRRLREIATKVVASVNDWMMASLPKELREEPKGDEAPVEEPKSCGCPYLAAISTRPDGEPWTSSKPFWGYHGSVPAPELAMPPTLDNETFDTICDYASNEYQEEALKTAMCPVIGSPIIYPLLGIIGETGEVIDKIRIHSQPGHTPPWQGSSRGDVIKEMGDVLWYSAVLADRLGMKLSSVLGYTYLNSYQSMLCRCGSRTVALEQAQWNLVLSVSRLSERTKKLFRDQEGVLDDKRRTEIALLLEYVLADLAVLAKTLKIEFSVVGRTNIEKLVSRRARNTIQGDGDDR